MSKWNERLAFAFFLISTVVTIGAIYGYQSFRLKSTGAIVIETYAPENGGFKPSTITIPAGKPAYIEVRNPETVSHGFAIPSLQAGIQEIKPGHVEHVRLPPLEPGTYEFFCSTWCTVNHMKMRGKIVVVPSNIAQDTLQH